MVSGHPTLATNIGSDWVFWQSGYPDLFATDAVLEQHADPWLVGALGIAGLTLLLGVAWRGKRYGFSISRTQPLADGRHPDGAKRFGNGGISGALPACPLTDPKS